jgi:FkbM family methyltransferase
MLSILKPDLENADPALFASVRRLVKPGMRVWDIGANLGLFGFAAAWMAGPQGRVLLVEADPWLCSLLQRSASGLAGKSYAETIVASCAITDHPGLVSFAIAARGRASNAISGFGNSQAGGSRGTLVVGCATLDQLLAVSFPPDVIKIDVEGAELSVLRGAIEVLGHRPALLLEVGEQNADEATAILRDASYSLYDAAADMRPIDRCVWTTAALPA